MNAVLSGRDVVLVAPTGAGKSLCFQAPALLRKNLTLALWRKRALERSKGIGEGSGIQPYEKRHVAHKNGLH